jgi:hypothetical protein
MNDLIRYVLRIAYYKGGHIAILLTLLSLGLVACGEPPTPYRPPTIAAYATPPILPSETPTSTPLPIQAPPPVAAPACTNNLTYLEDLSIPDGTVVSPGDALDKRWLVQNSGTCNWDDRYRLKFVSGSELGAPVEQTLYPARSGTEATIRILFTAPTEPGTYQSAWQAYDPQGQPFGDPVFIQIIIETTTP